MNTKQQSVQKTTDELYNVYGGELPVHIIPDTLGDVIKTARLHSKLTQEQLAERVKITTRYLMAIENEGKKPKYDVLFRLIRELAIVPDAIFYPDKANNDNRTEEIVRMLYNCDERSLSVVQATVKALIDTNPENQP